MRMTARRDRLDRVGRKTLRQTDARAIVAAALDAQARLAHVGLEHGVEPFQLHVEGDGRALLCGRGLDVEVLARVGDSVDVGWRVADAASRCSSSVMAR